MGTADLPAWLSGLAAMAATAGTTWWLTLKERRERKAAPSPIPADTQVVAATFTERGLMERLTIALGGVEVAVLASTVETKKLVELLEADAQRRHDEALIRKALKDRGIVE